MYARRLHTTLRVLNAVVTPPAPKKRPFRRFVFRTLLAAITFYGVGTYGALENDTFNDYFTEYVPLADELVAAVEENKGYFWNPDLSELRKKISDLKNRTVSVPQQGAISEQIEEAYKKVKASVPEVIKRSPIPEITHKLTNAEINALISKVNSLIRSVNDDPSLVAHLELVKRVDSAVNVLTKTLSDLELQKSELAQKLAHKTSDEAAVVEEALKSRETALMEKFFKEFNKELDKARAKYEAQLARDVEAAKAAAKLENENVTQAALVAQKAAFAASVTKSVEEERDGKLRALKDLQQKIDALADAEGAVVDCVGKLEHYHQVSVVLNSLKRALKGGEYQHNLEELDGSKIVAGVKKLSELTKDDDLLFAAVQAFPTEAVEKNGLLSNAQLLQRWNLLAPELRSAALLPPNAGVLGHLSAKFFSYFLISKRGSVAGDVSNDIESVIANVVYKLENGDLDDAVELVGGLKGWSRKLSSDWLTEARKKLEVEVLVDLVEAGVESKY